MWTVILLILGLQFLFFISSFNTFSASKKRITYGHDIVVRTCLSFCFVLLIRWTSKWDVHFLFKKNKIKSHIFHKPIVSSLLSFSCKTASINIYVPSTSEIYDVIWIIFFFFFFFYSAQYAKKNGLTQKKRMLAILGVSVAVMLLLIVSVVYCFVMKKKKGKEV